MLIHRNATAWQHGVVLDYAHVQLVSLRVEELPIVSVRLLRRGKESVMQRRHERCKAVINKDSEPRALFAALAPVNILLALCLRRNTCRCRMQRLDGLVVQKTWNADYSAALRVLERFQARTREMPGAHGGGNRRGGSEPRCNEEQTQELSHDGWEER